MKIIYPRQIYISFMTSDYVDIVHSIFPILYMCVCEIFGLSVNDIEINDCHCGMYYMLPSAVEAPSFSVKSIFPTGRIFPNHSQWSIQFDKKVRLWLKFIHFYCYIWTHCIYNTNIFYTLND